MKETETTIFLDSVQSGNEAMKEVQAFGLYAGPKLNFTKTQVIDVNADFQECIRGLQWAEEPVKYLGVFVSRKNENLEHLNWFIKLEKIKKIINLWKMRNLTYYGKVTIIKSLLVSQLVYVATVYTVPPKFVT